MLQSMVTHRAHRYRMERMSHAVIPSRMYTLQVLLQRHTLAY